MTSELLLKDIYKCSVCGYQYDSSAGDPVHGRGPSNKTS
jgi:rubredoxin